MTAARHGEVGAAAGARLAAEHGAGVDAVTVIEATARRLGFEPRREPGDGGLDIVLTRCPFADTAAVAPEVVCALHRGLADGIAAHAAGAVAVTGLVVQPAHRAGCRIQLAMSSPA